MSCLELDVHDRPDDLDDAADLLFRCRCCSHMCSLARGSGLGTGD
jgi:hypothetical protein